MEAAPGPPGGKAPPWWRTRRIGFLLVPLLATWFSIFSLEREEICQVCTNHRTETVWGFGERSWKPRWTLGTTRSEGPAYWTCREIFGGSHAHRWAPFGTRMLHGGVMPASSTGHSWRPSLTSPFALAYEHEEAFRDHVRKTLERGEVTRDQLRAICELPPGVTWEKDSDPARRALMALGDRLLCGGGLHERGLPWHEQPPSLR